jgi:hypothetical protein
MSAGYYPEFQSNQMKTPPIKYKYMAKDPQGYFVGYLKGKRKKVVEQQERFSTPEEALNALNLKQNGR